MAYVVTVPLGRFANTRLAKDRDKVMARVGHETLLPISLVFRRHIRDASFPTDGKSFDSSWTVGNLCIALIDTGGTRSVAFGCSYFFFGLLSDFLSSMWETSSEYFWVLFIAS
jgi:hypothetical protein